MPLNVQYHKHPTLLQWKGLGLFYWFRNHELVQEFTSHTFNEHCGSQSHEKNPKSERAVRRGWRFWFLFREIMIICRCQKNSRTFSSAIVRVWELMRPGFEPVTFLSADGPLSNLTRWHLCSEEGLAMESSLVQRNILRIIVSVWPVVTYMYFT